MRKATHATFDTERRTPWWLYAAFATTKSSTSATARTISARQLIAMPEGYNARARGVVIVSRRTSIQSDRLPGHGVEVAL
jgi:hypothetical protein